MIFLTSYDTGTQDGLSLWRHSASAHLANMRGNIKRQSCVLGIFWLNGVWRSLVARTAGGREVAGSSPVTPTTCGMIKK